MPWVGLGLGGLFVLLMTTSTGALLGLVGGVALLACLLPFILVFGDDRGPIIGALVMGGACLLVTGGMLLVAWRSRSRVVRRTLVNLVALAVMFLVGIVVSFATIERVWNG